MTMCTRNIRFLRKGDKGDKGDRGRLPVPYGEYSDTEVYTATDVVAPYVLCEGQYYVMNKTTTWIGASFNHKTPKQDYAQYGANATWILMEKYKAIFVELLMAELGVIGKAVFFDNYMFSQYGKTTSGQDTQTYGTPVMKGGTFVPNMWIDFLTGSMSVQNITIGKTSNMQGRILMPFTTISDDSHTLQTTDGTSFLLQGVMGEATLALPNAASFNGWLVNVYAGPVISKMDGIGVVIGRILVPAKTVVSGNYATQYYASRIELTFGGFLQFMCVQGQWTLINAQGQGIAYTRAS